MKRKAYKLLLGCAIVFAAVSMILYGASNSITFFYKPSELKAKAPKNREIRLGGIVKKGGVVYLDVNKIKFIITDHKDEILVLYTGPAPKLFREGYEAIVKGRLIGNEFHANQMLAKHDERYAPKLCDKAI